MAEQSVQTMLFPDLFAKPLVAQLDTPQQSSDGGAILLKAIDERLGFTARLAARLKDDPIHKLLVERDPVAGDPLASRPTLSRFENAIATRDLVRLTHPLADTVIAHRRVR